MQSFLLPAQVAARIKEARHRFFAMLQQGADLRAADQQAFLAGLPAAILAAVLNSPNPTREGRTALEEALLAARPRDVVFAFMHAGARASLAALAAEPATDPRTGQPRPAAGGQHALAWGQKKQQRRRVTDARGGRRRVGGVLPRANSGSELRNGGRRGITGRPQPPPLLALRFFPSAGGAAVGGQQQGERRRRGCALFDAAAANSSCGCAALPLVAEGDWCCAARGWCPSVSPLWAGRTRRTQQQGNEGRKSQRHAVPSTTRTLPDCRRQ